MMSWLSRSQPKAQRPQKAIAEELIHAQFPERRINWIKRSGLRRITIKIKSAQCIEVVSSLSAKRSVVEQFLSLKAKWIEKSLLHFAELDKRHPSKNLRPDEIFPFLGQDLRFRVLVTPLRTAFFSRQETHLSLHLPEPDFRSVAEGNLNTHFSKLRLFYKREAETFLSERIQVWAHEMNLHPRKLSYRNQKSLWGSCTARGHISLNWKLVACPLFVIDAILIHELSHLQEMNHSARFWKIVERFCPDYHLADLWLRDHQRQVDFLLDS